MHTLIIWSLFISLLCLVILRGRKDKPSTSHHQKTVQQENLWKAHPWIQGGKKIKITIPEILQFTVNAAALLHTALPSLIESSSLLATRSQIWFLPILKYILCWKDLLPVHFSQQEIKYITDACCGCTPSQKNHYPEQPPSTHPECFNTGILTVKPQINRM